MDKYTKFYTKSFKLFPTKVYRFFSKSINFQKFDIKELTNYSQERIKKYKSDTEVDLSTPSRTSLNELISSRRSVRNFSTEKVTKQELSTIIKSSIGEIEDNKKINLNFPSAGGLYPLEFYIGVFNVEDIAPGIYHYSLLDQKLTLIRDESFSKGLQVYLEQNKTICNSSFSLLISSSIEVSCAKYANKALQFAFIEMGHVTQNFMLNALEGGISSVAIGGIDSEILNRTLNLDGFIESIEYCCLFGKEEK